MASLDLFSVMMGIWRLTDTRFTPFMDFGKPVFVYYRRVLEIYEVAEQPDSNMLWLIVLICIAAVLLAGYYGHQRKRRNS